MVYKLKKLVAKTLTRLFFSNKYLKGRWFTELSNGWFWGYKSIFMQKIVGINRHIPWPVDFRTSIDNPERIYFHPDTLDNFQSPGCYYQTIGGTITIMAKTIIAPNVGFITANHSYDNLDEHTSGGDIIIGEECWIGMNSVILPGVQLARGTIVGANSLVNKSVEEEYCLIAGNPAKFVKKLRQVI